MVTVSQDLEIDGLACQIGEFHEDTTLGSTWPEVLSKASETVLKAQNAAEDCLSSWFERMKHSALDETGSPLLPSVTCATGDCPITTFTSLLSDEGFVSYVAAVGRLVAHGALGKLPSLPSMTKPAEPGTAITSTTVRSTFLGGLCFLYCDCVAIRT
jgi:hypothetical protein